MQAFSCGDIIEYCEIGENFKKKLWIEKVVTKSRSAGDITARALKEDSNL
jgi:hypothetical protein